MVILVRICDRTRKQTHRKPNGTLTRQETGNQLIELVEMFEFRKCITWGKRRLKLPLRRKEQPERRLRGKRKQERLTGRCVN